MAIPSDPTVTSIVTEGLKRGGRVNPSSTQITDAIEHQFREVKSDIMMRSARHPALITQKSVSTMEGRSVYSWPTDADDIRSITLVYAPTDGYWQGTATAGSTTTVTLDASFSQDEANVLGKWLFAVGGTGEGQFAQIVDYNNTTKVATVSPIQVTAFAAGTVYHIGIDHRKLFGSDKPWTFDTLTAPFQRGTPAHATLVGREIWTDYACDRIYALWVDYWTNLDRLDETGLVFVRHLRAHRSLWVQGVAVKTDQRYDEDRYQTELAVYNNMLDAYAGHSASVGQVQWNDI